MKVRLLPLVKRRLSIFEGRRSRFYPYFVGAYVAVLRSHRARLRIASLVRF